MDKAAAAAYGRIDLDCAFDEMRQDLRYTISEVACREVSSRLLKRNHERYAEEVSKGLHEKEQPEATKGKKEAKSDTQAGPCLIHEEEEA